MTSRPLRARLTTAGDRRVDEGDVRARPRDLRSQGIGGLDPYGSHLRPDRPGVHRVEGVPLQHDLFDRVTRGQHGQHDVDAGGGLLGHGVGRRAAFGQTRRRARSAVPHVDGEPLIEQALCDAGAHGAETDHRDCRAGEGDVAFVTHWFFSFHTDSGEGPPTRTSSLMMSSIRRSADASSSRSAAAIASSMCFGLRVPTMATCTAGLASTHAMASRLTDVPSSSCAKRSSAETTLRFRRYCSP